MRKPFLLLAFTLFISSNAYSQAFTLDSFAKAKVTLDRAVNAYGGRDNLASIANVSMKVDGDTIHRNQSRRPGAFDRTEYTADIVVDLKNLRSMQTQKGQYPGGFRWENGFVIDAGNRTSFDLIRKISSQPTPVTVGTFKASARQIPQLVLLNAIEQAETLRYLGKADYDKRFHDVIDYVSNDGARLALYIDEQTGFLSKYEMFITDRFSGDSVAETRFIGQKKVGSFIVPSGRVNAVNGDITNDFILSGVSFNSELRPDTFKVPEGFRTVTFPPRVPVTKHAEKIYTTSAGGYNVLFVDFNDYIFVMEAPGNERTSLQAIAEIKRTIPNKPIKYLAVTHHHDDHAGGIRTYMAQGATLIVVPGEVDFFKNVSGVRFTAEADQLTLNPRTPLFEPVQNGKRVLTDGTTTVEIYDIGNGPHTEQMLVAYFPAQKMIFQGDLLNRPANGDVPLANSTSVHFLEWIDKQKLPVEITIPVHGTPTTMAEFRKAVADMKCDCD